MELKVIDKRYELLTEIPNVEDAFIAQDMRSQTSEAVQIRLFRHPKEHDLFYLFQYKAKKLTQLSHPNLLSVLDYGYDQRANLYYVVYEHTSGKLLSRHLGRESFEWSLQLLLEICDVLSYLHANNVAHSSLYLESIIVGIHGDLPIKLCDVGLYVFDCLFHVKAVTTDEFMFDDIKRLGAIAEQLFTGKDEPTQNDLIAALRDKPQTLFKFFAKMYEAEGYKLYQSVNEIRHDLQVLLQNSRHQARYYLQLTRKVVQSLAETGFLDYEETYLAENLLNNDIKDEVYGRAEHSREEDNYIFYVTTARFRLLCTQDRDGRQTHLVVVAIHFLSPTELVAEKERSLLITGLVTIADTRSTPRDANTSGLTDMLVQHRLRNEAVRQRELSQKNKLDCKSSKQIGHKRVENKGDICDVFTLNSGRLANSVHGVVGMSAA